MPGGTAQLNPPNALITGKNPVSVSAWFKTSATTGAVIASYANASSSPTVSVPLLYVDTNGKLRGSYYIGTTTPATMLTSAATVNNGTWHHAALVAENGTQTLYLDGAVVDSRAATLSTTALNYNYLGYGTTTGYPAVSTPTNVLNGYLDDVRIYDKALTPAQVYRMYTNP